MDSLYEKDPIKAFKKGFQENYGKLMTLGGCYPGSKIINAFTAFNLCSFMFGTYLLVRTSLMAIDLEEFGIFTEAVHFLVLSMSINPTAVWFLMNAKSFDNIYRTVGHGFYNYGITFDAKAFNNMVDKKRYSGKIIKQKYTDAYIKLISTAGLTYGVLRSSYEWLTGQYDNAEYRDGIVRIMPLPLWFPFDIESKAHYIGAICLETYNTILNCLHSVCQEVPLISISEELCSEFQILAKGIEIFDQRAAALYKILYGNITEGNQIDKKKFERCIQLCLRDSVRHHVILKRTYEDLMRLFKIPLALCIFSSALMLCFSGISFTDESVPINVKCIFFVILTVEIAYTFIFCWYGQKIQDSSSEIGEVIYKTNWYKYPESVKRYILIMQPCAQRPLKLTAAGFIDVELPTFLDICKSAFSYFSLIQALNERL